MNTILNKKICRKAKWLSEEALQIAVKRKEVKTKEKILYNIHTVCFKQFVY